MQKVGAVYAVIEQNCGHYGSSKQAVVFENALRYMEESKWDITVLLKSVSDGKMGGRQTGIRNRWNHEV